jgi:hypothetical protein
MKRSLVALAAALFACCAAPVAASAADVTIGLTSPLAAPVCPPGYSGATCRIVLTQMTALSTLSDGSANPMVVKQTGMITSLSIGVSGISSNATTVKQDVAHLNSVFGGPPAARLTVLRQVGKASKENFQVVAQTPAFALQHYLGAVVQFPLIAPLPVVRGEVLALTVPTWAPVLSFNLATSKFAYRQSHSLNCASSATTDFAQLRIGLMTSYGCTYAGTRVEYSATEITSPTTTS